MINVQLSAHEAVVFKTLYDAGVFNIRNGKATLNFDAQGTLSDVECTMKLYKRGHAVIPMLITVQDIDSAV